eukprot:g5715.t1
MSTVFELLEASKCGLKVLGLALVTNECLGPGDAKMNKPTHEEVLSSVNKTQNDMLRLVTEVITTMDLTGYNVSCAYESFKATGTGLDRLSPSYGKCKEAPRDLNLVVHVTMLRRIVIQVP